MDRLSHIIADQVEADYWKPMKAGRNGPQISHLLFADDLLLFAEASVEQAHCIMHCLNQFCEASGQKINRQKTQIFFSKNTDQELRNDILQHTGFMETTVIGRYLGANIIHGRATRSHYSNIIDKIRSRLSGWKQQCLSLAGRVTLTQSVLSAVPFFHMQYTSLPRGICDEVEKLQRGFVWGDTEEKQRPHLVNWDTCCLPKKAGGLGFKRPREMNDAFTMKLLWGILTNPQDLWCQVLISKYGRNEHLLDHMGFSANDSPLWKALCSVRDKFMQNVTWRVGNGRHINFWLDKWLPGEATSLMSITTTHQVIDTTLSLFDLTNGNGEWNINALTEYIPPPLMHRLHSMPAPTDDDGPDGIGWRGTPTLYFTTKSAYDYLCNDQTPLLGDWKNIWSWKGPHRIQIFIWIGVHGRLLTNSRRHKWNDATSPICQACNHSEETQLHVLRDCMFATRVWLRLLPSSQVSTFFEAHGSSWFFDNLHNTSTSVQGHPWQTSFMVTTWFLWQWRNKSIFEEGFQRPHNEIDVILRYIEDITTHQSLKHSLFRSDTTLVRWNPPEEGWIKLNSDGACKGSDNIAGCGGLLRDSAGNWVKGFKRKLGTCNALIAEMWGMWIGIQMAWQVGVTKLAIESDSKVLVNMITHNEDTHRQHHTIVKRIRNLLARSWEVQISHTWREGNSCADWLANLGVQGDTLDTVFMDTPPASLHSKILDDKIGAPVPRATRTRC